MVNISGQATLTPIGEVREGLALQMKLYLENITKSLEAIGATIHDISKLFSEEVWTDTDHLKYLNEINVP